MTEASTIAAKLTKAQREAFLAAETHDGHEGEMFVRMYSVPDRFTKSYRVYGLGDVLNADGLAVRAILKDRSDG